MQNVNGRRMRKAQDEKAVCGSENMRPLAAKNQLQKWLFAALLILNIGTACWYCEKNCSAVAILWCAESRRDRRKRSWLRR